MRRESIETKAQSSTPLDEPKIYLVSILSEKHITRAFCMKVLICVFQRTLQEAEAITEEIRTNGEALCGGYIYEIAETKANVVKELAKREGFTIQCLIEEV